MMHVGESTIDEMIARVERGVWVTRFHYTHCPDPKRVIATGTTRDGTFLIEEGKVAPVLHATFPLREAAEAHRLMESSAHIGKIVLTVDRA